MCQCLDSIMNKTQATKKRNYRYFYFIYIQQTLSKRMSIRPLGSQRSLPCSLAPWSNCFELYVIISFDDDHGKSKEKNYLCLRVVVILACFKSSKCQH